MAELVNTPNTDKVSGKVLSLCFPTYNRGWCMKEQINRLLSCPKETLDKIEILVSDNCSNDDTQQIVEDAIAKGFICQYIRNETNLGMDGNFVNCFQKASGRYVWLLGDDDTIIIKSLEKIVKILDVPDEYGLLHIYQKKDLQQEIIYVNDKNEMAKYVSYYITFISANIVNKQYVSFIDFERYMGTWFTLVPLYITALIKEQRNIVYGTKTFEEAKDYSRNGGYNFFEVFVRNFQNILKEFIGEDALDKETFDYIKKDIFSFVWRNAKKIWLGNAGNYGGKGGFGITCSYYWNTTYFWANCIRFTPKYLYNKLLKKK